MEGAVATHENVHGADKSEIDKDLKYEVANPNSKTGRPSKEDRANQAEQRIINAEKKKNQQ